MGNDKSKYCKQCFADTPQRKQESCNLCIKYSESIQLSRNIYQSAEKFAIGELDESEYFNDEYIDKIELIKKEVFNEVLTKFKKMNKSLNMELWKLIVMYLGNNDYVIYNLSTSSLQNKVFDLINLIDLENNKKKVTGGSAIYCVKIKKENIEVILNKINENKTIIHNIQQKYKYELTQTILINDFKSFKNQKQNELYLQFLNLNDGNDDNNNIIFHQTYWWQYQAHAPGHPSLIMCISYLFVKPHYDNNCDMYGIAHSKSFPLPM